MRIVLILIIAWFLLKYFSGPRRFNRSQTTTDPVKPISVKEESTHPEPDVPIPFGWKIPWLAVKTDDPYKVAEVLGIVNLRPANWRMGRETAYFITPQLEEWILVVPYIVFEPDELIPFLKRISAEFEEVQYFNTHRVVESHLWAKARAGEIVRAYGFCGCDGEVLVNIGEPTPEEKKLGLDRLFASTEKFANYPGDPFSGDKLIPGEEDVWKIAREWSVDPLFESKQYPPGIGFIGD